MRIAMLGDVMLGRLVNEALEEMSPEYPWGDTLPLLREADLRICNLECAVSDDGRPWTSTPKEFHFRSDSKNVGSLLAAWIDLVSLANNHVLDYGYEGLADTLEVLDRSGIAHAGAGQSLREAEAMAVVERQGTRIGMIAFTDNDPGWEATSERPGTFYVPVDLQDGRAKRLLELITKAKEGVDVLIASGHCGPNWGYSPPSEHIPFAHAVLEAGADLMFGHSGHVFRGIEVRKGKPILYCAGDFVDDYAVDFIERNDESFVFELETGRHAIRSLRMYPTKIGGCRARLAKGAETTVIAEKMRRLCAAFNTEATWEEASGSLEVDLSGPGAGGTAEGRPRTGTARPRRP